MHRLQSHDRQQYKHTSSYRCVTPYIRFCEYITAYNETTLIFPINKFLVTMEIKRVLNEKNVFQSGSLVEWKVVKTRPR